MADKKLSQESSLTKSTVATNDLIYTADVSANTTKSMTYQEMMQPTDANFRIAGSSDNTKLVAFEVDGLTTATTRTVTIPDADTTMVGTGTTQTLTNKTLSTGTTFNGYNKAVVITDASGVASALTGTSGQIVSFDTSNVPVAIANPSASDGSTTVKGVFEANTQAEADAGTGTPDTTATLIPTTATIRARLLNTGVTDTGSSTAYAIAPTPAITAYASYQEFTFKAVNANTTTTPTLNVNSVGAKTIINPDGTALKVGQISANSIVKVVYDGTNFQLFSATGISTIYKNGTTTKNIADADTTQNIAHGLGVVPRRVRVTVTIPGSGTNYSNQFCYGVYDSGSQNCNYFGFNNASNVSGNNSTLIKIYSTVVNSAFTVGTASVDATNISIAWVKTASPTGTATLVWEAEA